MRITVRADVPVFIEIEGGTITRVVVADTEIREKYVVDTTGKGREVPIPPDVRAILDGAIWPAWECGW